VAAVKWRREVYEKAATNIRLHSAATEGSGAQRGAVERADNDKAETAAQPRRAAVLRRV